MPSPVKDQEIAAEQRLVDHAYERLDEMRAAAQAMIREGYRQAQAGTRASLVDRDAMVHQAAQRVQALNIADDGLVFGRLDLVGGERRYVGRIGVRTSEHESLVIDWRAPAAEAFYRATPEDPREVIRRRVLHSRGHQVIDLEDDLLRPGEADGLTVVGDGAFLASLARTREGSMRDIVATIQREQDEVIRAPADGTVIVRGGPGTGKTAVALHRVAYLLFHHRRRFGTRGVLIVGPNRRFTAYIERVLPSLGEGAAALRSLGDLVDGVSANRHDPPGVIRIKGAGIMARVMRRAVTDPPPGAPDEVRVVHAGVVVRLERADLDRIRDEVHRRSRGSVNRARGRAADLLVDALWNRFTAVGGLSDVPDAKRREFAENVTDQRTFTEFLAAWWPVRRPDEVLRALGAEDRLRRAAGRDLRPEQVRLLAASFAATESAGFSYQDVALLDEIAHLLGPPPRVPRSVSAEDDPFVVEGVDIFTGERVGDAHADPYMREVTSSIERLERARRVDGDSGAEAGTVEDYGHIVVDEAQDLSPMQWRMLGRRGRFATWTVVEDPAQSAWEDLVASREAMDAALGVTSEATEIAVEIAAIDREARGHEAPATAGAGSRPGLGDGAGQNGQSGRRDGGRGEGRGRGRTGGRDGGRGGARGGGRGGSGERGARGGRRTSTRPLHEFRLTTNYRNSVEIAEVAARVLELAVPGSVPARAVRRSGNPPAVRLAGDALPDAVRTAVTELLDQVEGTIGLIIPVEDVPEAHGGAGGEAGGGAGGDADGAASPAPPVPTRGELAAGLPERVQVLDVLEAKGLEFDAAVIVTPERVAAQSPTGTRVLYVAVSRATQRLTVLTTDPGWADLLTGRSGASTAPVFSVGSPNVGAPPQAGADTGQDGLW